ncbi:MAG: ABC transporter permease [Actinobacteria bacterium]|nr:ABC transporter permease [Actinomycetota bacterium]
MSRSGRLDDLRTRADQVLLLAGLTWKEGVRRRTILMGFLLTVAFVALYGTGTYYAFRQFDVQPDTTSMGGVGALGMALDPDFYRDLAAYQMLSFGLFVSSFLSAMLVVFLGAGMISGDAENGTLQTIVTRPVARVQVLMGRFLGYASVLVVYTIVLSGSLLLLTRVFSGYAPPHPEQALLLLLAQGLIVLGIVALATSTLPQIATGITGLMLFGVAFIGGIVEQIGTFLGNDTAAAIGDAVHYLAPTDTFFRMALGRLTPGSMALVGEFLTGPFGAPKGVETGALLYGLLYLAACLVGAALLFRRRDL